MSFYAYYSPFITHLPGERKGMGERRMMNTPTCKESQYPLPGVYGNSRYPFTIYNGEEVVDLAGNSETVNTILYGDLSYRPTDENGDYIPFVVTGPEGVELERVRTIISCANDCWGTKDEVL